MANKTENMKQHLEDVERIKTASNASANSRCSDSAGSEPLRISLSRQEIEDKAKAYLLDYFDGKPNDDFYLRFGMMVDFSHFLFHSVESAH
jgi:hypothetical protein